MSIEEQYQYYQRKNKFKIIYITLGIAIVSLLCLSWNATIGPGELSAALLNYFSTQTVTGENTAAAKVVLFLRLPRICLAILAGFGLAAAGLMMQSVTRNFLVSPFTLGVSSAAAFGASLCIVFGNATIFFNDFLIIGSAFIAAMLSMLIVFTVAKKVGITANSVILVGIALNYFFAALTASLQFFAQENKLAAVVQWTFGTFNRANWDAVIIIGAVTAFCSFFAIILLSQWNAMASSNDELVRSLGISPQKLRGLTMFLAVLITATIISFTGVIGFVGLIAPHIARLIIGNDHHFLFPLSGLIGSGLLVLSDTFGKFILYPVNVPVGIVVSFLGVPVFIHLILHTGKSDL